LGLSVRLCMRAYAPGRRHSPTGLPSTSSYFSALFVLFILKFSEWRIKSKGKGSPYSMTERRVPELIPVLGCLPAGDVSHKPGGRLPLLSARPTVTPAPLKRAATNFAASRHDGCEQFA